MNYAIHFIGEHPEIVRTRRLITRVAESPTRTVLIYGETGTGKGLVARMIHGQSSRAGASFIDVNCAAIPSNLAESELFGYERGAFTGALSKKTGLVEAASGGSLFLDEIRELEPALQAKLLSLLDTQEFRRVGAIGSKISISRSSYLRSRVNRSSAFFISRTDPLWRHGFGGKALDEVKQHTAWLWWPLLITFLPVTSSCTYC